MIVELKYEAVSVSRQFGHTKASFAQDTYAHMFDKAKHADELRDRLEERCGHLLNGVDIVSTGGGKVARITASVGQRQLGATPPGR
jgi:hypothetical protein